MIDELYHYIINSGGGNFKSALFEIAMVITKSCRLLCNQYVMVLIFYLKIEHQSFVKQLY